MSIAELLSNKASWHIEPGDVMAGLRALPANSVNCVCTSPPYFGLRAYGTSPQVWGGDADCPHDFRSRRYYRASGGGARSSSEAFSEPGPANSARIKAARWQDDTTCALCGAWRGEYGSEPTPALFVEHTVAIFREVRRVLHPAGVLWLNMGDSYSGAGYSRQDNTGGAKREQGGKQKHTSVDNLPAKNLLGMPWRVAFGLQDDGWILRSDIIWHKPSPMPESVCDRPTKAHEYIFLFAKSARYFFDADSVREGFADVPHTGSRVREQMRAITAEQTGRRDGFTRPPDGVRNPAGRNLRSVWTIPSQGFAEAHFATFPTEIPRRCILAGSSEHGVCSKCGAPWGRVVERAAIGERHISPKDNNPDRHDGPLVSSSRLHNQYFTYQTEHLGWQPSCTCAAPTVPAVVLDPFAGSGTTLMVALRLGRRALGLELNESYVQLARKRIEGDAPLFNSSAWRVEQEATA
jgi:DNA modification methylase